MTEEERQVKFTAEDKLHYEVQKLTEEVRVLKHPFSQPASWIASIALILSVASNIWQFYTSEMKKILIDTQVEKAKLDKAQLEKDSGELESKRDKAKAEFERINGELESIRNVIAKAKQESNSTQIKDQLGQAEQKVANLEQKTQATAQQLNTSESTATQEFRSNLQVAKAKEREGFQALINGDYDGALAAFQASENAVNSYHMVYEFTRLLKANKSQMGDPAKKKEIFQKIVKEYSFGAPPDLLAQVKAIANQ